VSEKKHKTAPAAETHPTAVPQPVPAPTTAAAPPTTVTPPPAATPVAAAPSPTATATATLETPAPQAALAEVNTRLQRFAQRVTKELREARDAGLKQWEGAVKSAREFVRKAKPELKREDVAKIGENVRKDVRKALGVVKTRSDGWTRSGAFLTARDKGAQFLLRLALKVKKAAGAIESNLEETLKYRTGDLVGKGTFVCVSCAKEVTVEAGAIPACVCGKDSFKRKG
jgi:hypothetical protein